MSNSVKLDIQFLSSLLNNPSSISTLDKEVAVEDFSDPLYYEIYTSIMAFYIEGKSPTISDLRFRYREDALLLELLEKVEAGEVVDNINLVYSALCEQNKKERLKKLSVKLSKLSESKDTSSDSIIEEIESSLVSFNIERGKGLSTVSDFENDYLQDLYVRVEKYGKFQNISSVIEMPTGFQKLDEATLGLQRKNIWLIGGATSIGKTQLAVQIMNSVLLSGQSVYYFMLEDSKEQLLTRLLSLRTGVPISKIRTGNINDVQIKELQQTLNSLRTSSSLYIEDDIVDINQIVMKVRFAKLKHPELGLIVIDHIGNALDSAYRGPSREQEITLMSKKILTLIAKRENIAALVLQQLNANPDDRKSGMPVTNNDVRDSKSTTFDAAVVTLMHCPDKYDESMSYSKEHTQLIVSKNRYGEANIIVNLTSRAAVGRFIEGIPKGKVKNGTTT